MKNDNNKQRKAPFIGLVPIPALLIDRVDVDFQDGGYRYVKRKKALPTQK